MSDFETFVCKECGFEVTRYTLQSGYAEGVCFLCNWINTNPKLTEKERADLQERFKLKTRGSVNPDTPEGTAG